MSNPTSDESPTQHEIRARRLVVTDERGTPRITGEVVDSVAELRVVLSDGDADSAYVLLYAAPGEERGPNVGIRLWADGCAQADLSLSLGDGRWAP